MHSIQIPDKLWELYGGSPQRMRDTLWQVAFSDANEQELPAAAAEEVENLDRGTEIDLEYSRLCSICRKAMPAGSTAIIRTVNEKKQILHPTCA